MSRSLTSLNFPTLTSQTFGLSLAISSSTSIFEEFLNSQSFWLKQMKYTWTTQRFKGAIGTRFWFSSSPYVKYMCSALPEIVSTTHRIALKIKHSCTLTLLFFQSQNLFYSWASLYRSWNKFRILVTKWGCPHQARSTSQQIQVTIKKIRHFKTIIIKNIFQ